MLRLFSKRQPTEWQSGQKTGVIVFAILCNAQRHQCNLKGAKDVVLIHQQFCWNLTAHFWLQRWNRLPYFGAILSNDVAIKSEQKISAQKFIWIGTKNAGEIDTL
jgi:hypothetical protein